MYNKQRNQHTSFKQLTIAPVKNKKQTDKSLA